MRLSTRGAPQQGFCFVQSSGPFKVEPAGAGHPRLLLASRALESLERGTQIANTFHRRGLRHGYIGGGHLIHAGRPLGIWASAEARQAGGVGRVGVPRRQILGHGHRPFGQPLLKIGVDQFRLRLEGLSTGAGFHGHLNELAQHADVAGHPAEKGAQCRQTLGGVACKEPHVRQRDGQRSTVIVPGARRLAPGLANLRPDASLMHRRPDQRRPCLVDPSRVEAGQRVTGQQRIPGLLPGKEPRQPRPGPVLVAPPHRQLGQPDQRRPVAGRDPQHTFVHVGGTRHLTGLRPVPRHAEIDRDGLVMTVGKLQQVGGDVRDGPVVWRVAQEGRVALQRLGALALADKRLGLPECASAVGRRMHGQGSILPKRLAGLNERRWRLE